jgi:hypothetical protein
MRDLANGLLAAGFRPRSCARKDTYASRPLAERAAQHYTAKRGWKLFVYRCERCKGWHLTKHPQFQGGKP